MERIVYLLGAGFSAPLGLPVVSNFLERSKDQYFAEPEKFEHFQQVFDTIRGLAVAKNYYATDLFNIEDILSILEIREALADDRATERSFKRYVGDVIRYHTPAFPGARPGTHWTTSLFADEPWASYAYFVSAILGKQWKCVRGRAHTNSIEYDPLDEVAPAGQYSVITLNYDTILEHIDSTLHARFDQPQTFIRPDQTGVKSSAPGTLAKLHGSIDTGNIVPPTWNKGLADAGIIAAWQSAYDLLAQANHIRILGYSLPESDSYLKYLLRAAVVDAKHLKRLDVLCMDPDGSVRKRYSEFLTFKGWRFLGGDIRQYLRTPIDEMEHWPEQVTCDGLERAHRTVFR